MYIACNVYNIFLINNSKNDDENEVAEAV